MSDRRKTLLIVDNDEAMRESLTGVLRPRHAPVLRAGTGEGALQMMEKEDVDLMILDAQLPGISGFESSRSSRRTIPTSRSSSSRG